ncbi:hypothetical protein FB45DRAFT_287137 [Roridomyces roridus]|uniref:Uncharacterized protein n=1 Tax=Roridomyces roridus TaxID=1738132 RepID=A0AAD7FX29_9AGAR|nr:hypothetical protein FB45DRAFT_287137 [Roridomyces roridus]
MCTLYSFRRQRRWLLYAKCERLVYPAMRVGLGIKDEGRCFGRRKISCHRRSFHVETDLCLLHYTITVTWRPAAFQRSDETMTTHARSLPSFAQAFNGDHPIGSISGGNNSLPPIHSHSPPVSSRRAKSPQGLTRSRHPSEEERSVGRKRPRSEVTSSVRDEEPSDSERDSRFIRVKEEEDLGMLDDTPPQQRIILDPTGAPPPSSIQPSAKKRRITVSGPALNTDVRAPADSTTPISPAVSMGFSINNPGAIEQVRSMITVKQKQKALIEQRRASVVGSPNLGAAVPPPALCEERAAPVKAPPPTTRQRRSPNNNTRRVANGTQVRPPSPVPVPALQQPPPPVATQNSLPPPPISFARRRAEQLGGRRKTC